MATTAQLKVTADALEALDQARTGNATEDGWWRRIALALEAGVGAASAANETLHGWMLRSAVAAEALWGGSGAAENRTYEGLLKRVVDALEISAGAVVAGSLGHRLATAALSAEFIHGNFTNGTLPAGWTYSGNGGLGTRTNSAGVMVASVADQPRFDYSPTTLASRGILVEPARTNLCLYSMDISNAAWVKNNAPVIAANSTAAPDGTATADTLTDDTATNFKFILQTIAVAASSTYAQSLFIKKAPGATSTVALQGRGTTGGTAITVAGRINPDTGNKNAAVTEMEDRAAYWRGKIGIPTNPLNTVIEFSIYPASGTNSGGNPGADNVAAQGSAIIWGAQLELGATSSTFIPTTAAAVTRTADVLTRTALPAGNYRLTWDDATTTDIVHAGGDYVVPTAAQRRLKTMKWTG